MNYTPLHNSAYSHIVKASKILLENFKIYKVSSNSFTVQTQKHSHTLTLKCPNMFWWTNYCKRKRNRSLQLIALIGLRIMNSYLILVKKKKIAILSLCARYIHKIYIVGRLWRNMQIRYLICAPTATEHMGNTWVHSYPHTKFHHSSPQRTLDICLCIY